jgi:6-phosphogluconate dehydrogenase
LFGDNLEKNISAIGVFGSGNMGKNIALKLSENYKVISYDRERERYKEFENTKVQFTDSVEDFIKMLKKNDGHIVWLMIPGGAATNEAVASLSSMLENGDIVIDGSNALYEDSIKNYMLLKNDGKYYLDVGCCGGPLDVLAGISFIVGGDKIAYNMAENIFRDLAGKNGTYGYVGGAGWGHRVKLIHNGIFYGIFPIYAEGIELLFKMGEKDKNVDLDEACRLLAKSQVINGEILDTISKMPKPAKVAEISEVKVSEMVKWEVKKAKEIGVSLSTTEKAIDGYKMLSESAKRILSEAKRIITGH